MLDEEGCVEHESYLRSLLTEEVQSGEEDQNGTSLAENGNAASSTADPFERGRQRKKERELKEARRKEKTLLSIRNMLGAILVVSLFVFDWSSSLVLSQCLLLALFTLATQSSFLVWAYARAKVERDIIEPEQQRSGTIWRGVFLSVAVSVVADSMSLASWIAFPTFISAERLSLPVGLLFVSLFMAIRIAVSVVALVLSSMVLHNMNEVGGGIFSKSFSIIIGSTKTVSDHLFHSQQRPLWTAFEGRGITLGRRG